jgi:DNA-directed RNA polymerase specialized sigma24 family protein
MSSETDSTTRRLDVLIRLALDEQLARKTLTRKDQLLLMDSVGLSTGEISKILGQPSKDVSSALKKAKSEKGK